MTKNWKWIFGCLTMLAMTLGMVACSEDNGQVDATPTDLLPGVTLTAKTVGDTTLSFMLSPKSADQAAWLCVEQATTVTAEQVLAEGEEVDAKKAAVYTVAGLQPETTYAIYAAVKNAHGVTLSEALKMTTAEEIPVPTATLEKVGQEYEKLTFTITTTNAETVKWMLTSSQAAVTASRILELGTEVEANTTVEQIASGKGMAGTELAIYAVAVLGEMQVLSEPLLWTPEKKPALEANYELEATTATTVYTAGSQLDNYLFTFANEAGDTLVLEVDLTAGDFNLEDGEYEVVAERKADGIYAAGSTFTQANGSPVKVVSGEMEMSVLSTDDFVLDGEFVLEDEKVVSLHFEGALGLPERPQYYDVDVESATIEAGGQTDEWVVTLKNTLFNMTAKLYFHNPRNTSGTDYLPAATYFVRSAAPGSTSDGNYGWIDATKSVISYGDKEYKLLADKFKAVTFETEMGSVEGKKDKNTISFEDLPSEDEMAFFTMSYSGGMYGLGEAVQTSLPLNGHTHILELEQEGNNFYICLHRPQATDVNLYIQTTDGYLAGDPASASFLFGRTYKVGTEGNCLLPTSFYLEPAVGTETNDARYYFTEGGITILPQFVKDADGKDTEELDPYSYLFSIDQTGLVGVLEEPLTRCTFTANAGGWTAAFQPKVSVEQLGVEGRTLKFSISSERCEEVKYMVWYLDPETNYLIPVEEDLREVVSNSSDYRPVLQYGTAVEVNTTVELTCEVPGPGKYAVHAAGRIGQQYTFPTVCDYNPIYLEVTE